MHCLKESKERGGEGKKWILFCTVVTARMSLGGISWDEMLSFCFPPNYFSYILSLSILECISLCFLPLLGAHALFLLCCFFRLMENSSDAQQHGNTLELHDAFMQKKMEKEDGKEGYLMLLL